ncbi:efflux RND transporter periplasmic adaptor subunit [uncultured Cohaesibacter sp.]|uniref:efflux RND transporter periplasmic adaptor subunit n=1 Tax=uncultured Cohaesibacter sp. TaxID=1002546 RepID=UPI002AAAF0AB|nr:efflux RND transporter periplasmic adaptor subunit [uncultured Cohaesibacter sp.]
MKKHYLLPLIAGLLIGQGALAASEPRPVKLLLLEPAKETVQRRFFGQIRARETVDLAFQVGGQIVNFPIKEGSRLNKGDLVAQLDLENFDRVLKEAQINLQKAERELRRYEKLQGTSISRTQVEDAQTAYALAQIALDRARDERQDASLTAPFDALVARREVANYTTVSAGTAVVRLQDVSELHVDIEIPEILAQRSTNGSVAFSASFPGIETSYPLEIREFETDAGSITQTYRLTLALTDTPKDHRIFPGSSVSVTVKSTASKPTRILLPKTALVYDAAGNPGVLVFHPSPDDKNQGTVSREPVSIKIGEDASIIQKSGLKAGTEIVATGATLLTEGQTVRRFEGIGD